MPHIRAGEAEDVDAAVAVWRSANTARRGGQPVPDEHEHRVRGYMGKEDAFFLVAEDRREVVGMALGMQALEDDGVGPPSDGLCHISAVFVAPDHWGKGIGRQTLLSLMSEARKRGYGRAQLWTHADNERAHRLYRGLGFVLSGREKPDDLGDLIVHYERPTLA